MSDAPKVFNIKNTPPGVNPAFIGRGSPWGNPFVIGRDGDRETVIAKHERWIATQPLLLARVRNELRGRPLMCFCAPLACHGDTLLRIANAPESDA